jgi:hypothetical protein
VTPRTKALLVGVAVLAVGGIAVAGAARPTGGAPAGDGRMVLVSGRDDHGLLADEHVALRSAPDKGATTVGEVDDGTLARVLEVRGSWLELATAEGPTVRGWVDDYYLRGILHLVGPAPTCQVPFAGGTLPEGEQAVVLDERAGRIRVRVARTGATGWVERSLAREIVPEHCGQPDPEPSGHHHGG